MEYLLIILRDALTSNLALTSFLGMFCLLAATGSMREASAMGLTLTLVMVIAVPVNSLLEKYLLSPGALAWLGSRFAVVDAGFLRWTLYAIVMLLVSRLVALALQKAVPQFYAVVGRYMPYLAVSSAVLGVSLLSQQAHYALAGALCSALGAGIGFFIVMVALAAIRQRLRYSPLPEGLKGVGILLLTIGLMSLSFWILR